MNSEIVIIIILQDNEISKQREVNLGISKLDFKVGDTYLEVKTPLTTINVKYGKDIKTLMYPQQVLIIGTYDENSV